MLLDMAGCRPLSDQECAKLIMVLNNQRDKTLFILGLKTGFRISELLSLRFKDVWDGKTVLESVKVTRALMKGGAGKRKLKVFSREVVLHETAREAITSLVTVNTQPEDFLFQSREGLNRPISLSQASHILKQAYETAGVQGSVATHSMRKTFADKMYAALDHDIVATRDALGHSDVGTTQKYITVNRSRINKAIRET